MAGVLDVERFSLHDVADRLGVHVTTVWRWTSNGVRGRWLRTHMVGGRRYVSMCDLEAFLSDPEVPDDRHPDSQRVSAEAASKQLDASGIKPR